MDIAAVAERVSAGEPISRPEAEAYIRVVERRCLGKPVVPADVQQSFFDRLQAGEAAEDLLGEFEKIAPTDLRRYAQARLASRRNAEEALADALRAHQGDVGTPCGRDFNEEVLAHPFDGEEREYACPQCGVTGSYRSPLILTVEE